MTADHFSSLFGDAPFAFAHHEIIRNSKNKAVDYRYIYVNDAFCEHTGLKKPIVGKTVRELIPGIERAEFDWISFYGNLALQEGKMWNFSGH